jgi:uncharacterized YigZ family protein
MSNPARYPIPAEERRVSDEVKGSRFVTTAACAPDVEAARSFVARIRAEFPDATHHCWAYVIGPPGSTIQNGSSDDGEPGGTAGSPILNVILNSGVGDIVVVVTRYFGGVKLGRGGLVRSYGGGARMVLRELPLTERVAFASASVVVDYPAVETVRRLVSSCGGDITREVFESFASFEVQIPDDRMDEFEKALTEATSGGARVQKADKPAADADPKEGQRR